MSQPPLSRQVRDLEEELGVALFHHGAKAVRLTDAGKAFLSEARAVLHRADEAVKNVKAVANGERGEIQVGYAPSLTVELLPRALQHFQAGNPAVRVRLHDMSTQEMLRGLRDGRLHVALLVQVSAKVMAEFVFQELRRYAVCVAMHAGHRLARTRTVGLKQLVKERLVAFTIADYPEHHLWLAGLFAPFDLSPQIAEEHDSATSLIASVEAGRGVALVQEAFKCFAGPRVKVRALVPAPPPISVGVAFRAGANSPILQRFITALKQ